MRKKNFLVDQDFIHTRIDRWFKKNICHVPQSLIEKSLRKGNIKINNVKIKSSYNLKKDDVITIKNITFKVDTNKKNLERYIPRTDELKSSHYLFIENNQNFAVINKPSGISVQSGTKSKRNILDILRSTKEFKDASPFTVHRIDKETSGVLIVAKNRRYAQLFTSLFRIRKIHKTYLCIVFGKFNHKKGTLRDDLFYYDRNKKIKLRAITHFKVLDSNNYYSFLELNPETGRKHQLRKQLLIHGCPILGDKKYKIPNINTNHKSNLMLHSYKINFSINSVKYNYLANLPKIFKVTLKEKSLKNFSQ